MCKSSLITFLLAFVAGEAIAQTAPAAARPASAQAAVASAAASSSAAPAEFKIKGAPESARGTIATITDLAQQLKVEQLRRDLREAKQHGGGDATAIKVAAGSLGLPPPPAVAVSAQKIQNEKQPPSVTAILGLGGRLRARLADGRDLLVGQEALGWTVKGISPSTVSFEHCSVEKSRTGKTESTCTSRTVAPVPM